MGIVLGMGGSGWYAQMQIPEEQVIEATSPTQNSKSGHFLPLPRPHPLLSTNFNYLSTIDLQVT